MGKTYVLKLVDNAMSLRKNNRSVETKPVDTARSTKEEDRSVESLVEFIEGGEAQEGRREKKQKRKKKKSSLTGNAEGDGADMEGLAVADEDRVALEPISEGLSEVKEDSGVCTELKKPKRKKKQSDREILKPAHENNLHGTSGVASGSEEIVETIEAEKDKEDPSPHLVEDQGNPLTRELMAKEAELHELLESEVHLVESKGKEMSSLLSAVDELEDEKHGVDKKVAEIDAQMGELQVSKDHLVKQKGDKDKKHHVDKKVAEIDSQMAELQISKDQLVKSTEDKDEKLDKLLKKKNKLENFIEEKVSENKETKRRLEKEIKEIKVRFKETQLARKSEAQPESLKLLAEYVNDQIESKETELECPVCMEVASAPLFCCDDQHLICAECRPKVRSLSCL